jgi:hypothetical protein
MKNRYTERVGRKWAHGFRTTIRRARKKGTVIGRKAHPVLALVRKDKLRLPTPKRVLSKDEWHIEYLIRCAKRGEDVQVCNLKY